MSRLNFKPQNHPQQVAIRGPVHERDERYTPLSLFEPLHDLYRFTLDAAGTPLAPVSQRIGRWVTREQDGLSQNWDSERVWCNGPFSDVRPWVEKAWNSKGLVVQLWPANRTEQGWWHDLVEPYRDKPGSPLLTEFVRRRRQFGTPTHPKAEDAQWHSTPPYGIVLLKWRTGVRP